MAVNGAARVPVASQTASASAIRDAAPAKSPHHTTAVPSAASMIGSWSSAPSVPGRAGPAEQHRPPAVVVPQGAGGRLSEPAPPDGFIRGDAGTGKGADGLPQRRRRRDQPVGDQQGQAVEDQAGRIGRIRGRQGPGGAGDLQQVPGARQGGRANSAAIHALR